MSASSTGKNRKRRGRSRPRISTDRLDRKREENGTDLEDSSYPSRGDEIPHAKDDPPFASARRSPIGICVVYLEGTDKKTIADTGITAERLASPGYKVKPVQTLAEGLRKVGLTPADVEVIILTHLHHHHYSQARVFPNAEVIVQRSELEFTPNPIRCSQACWRPTIGNCSPDCGSGSLRATLPLPTRLTFF